MPVRTLFATNFYEADIGTPDLLEELETRLLTADVGVEATGVIIDSLTKRVARKELADSGALYKALQEELGALLKPVEQPLLIAAEKHGVLHEMLAIASPMPTVPTTQTR